MKGPTKAREPILQPFTPRNAHTVSVTLEEAALGAIAAFARRIEDANRKNRRRNAQGLKATKAESLAKRVSGLSGEAALAVYLGLPPVRIADEWRNRPDALCFDAMTTDKAHGALIVTPRDRLDMMKVLVIDRSPVFHLCGWYRVSDVRTEAERRHSEWWRQEREHGGAWYVPQPFLRALWDEEAQRELARYSRQWSGTEYVSLAHVWNGMLAEPLRDLDRLLPEANPGLVLDAKVIEQSTGVRAALYQTDTTDWREVLRRAGAAPPEPTTQDPSPPTDRGTSHGQG